MSVKESTASRPREMTVELRKHIGTRNTPLGPVEVEHDQWIVVALRNGTGARQVGYLNKREGAKIMWLAGDRDRFGDFICGQIEEAAQLARAELMMEGVGDGK